MDLKKKSPLVFLIKFSYYKIIYLALFFSFAFVSLYIITGSPRKQPTFDAATSFPAK